MYYKIVKVTEDKLVSAVAANDYMVEYKVGEWVKSNFPGFALFATDNIEATLKLLIGSWDIVDNYIVAIKKYAVYTCEIIQKPLIYVPEKNFSFEDFPVVSFDSSLVTERGTVVAEQIKLVRQLDNNELKKIME
jgi:hypothetical protein